MPFTHSNTAGSMNVKYRHGLSGTLLYDVWSAIKARCCNPKHKDYYLYGGRGIAMCEKWIDDPAAFVADMGPRPKGMMVERKDNDGPYSPENCKWATPYEQRHNQRQHKPSSRSRWLSFKGETKRLCDWATELGVKEATIHGRLRGGLSVESALSAPVSPSAIFIEHDGRRMCLSAWDKAVGAGPGAVSRRIRNGWDPVRAVSVPFQKKRKRS